MPAEWTNLQRSKWKYNAPLVTGTSFGVMLGGKDKGWKSLSPIGFMLLRKIKLQIQILDTALSLKADAIKCFANQRWPLPTILSFFLPQNILDFSFSCHDTGAMVESGCDQLLSRDSLQRVRVVLCDCDLQQWLPPEPGLWPHNGIKRSL